MLDVRRRRGERQIHGAVRYNPGALMKAERLELPLDHTRRIVLDADDSGDVRSLWWRFSRNGYKQVVGLAGGFDAWDAAGLPEEDAAQDQPIPGARICE